MATRREQDGGRSRTARAACWLWARPRPGRLRKYLFHGPGTQRALLMTRSFNEVPGEVPG